MLLIMLNDSLLFSFLLVFTFSHVVSQDHVLMDLQGSDWEVIPGDDP